MRAKRHRVKAADVIAIDAANDAARDQRENKSVGKHDGAGAQRGQNAVLDLIEEIRGVHQRQRQARDGVFREQLVDVAADEI